VVHAPADRAISASFALERVGGVGYASASNGDSSVSAVAFGIGGASPNPYSIPRVGVDWVSSSGVTVGGALGFSYFSGSAKNRGPREDVGSVTLYSLTPRVGYRAQLSDRLDLIPRAGLTFAGGSVSPNGEGSASIFALAVSADVPLVFRLTDSFNALAGLGVDYTVHATASTGSSSGSSRQSSSDVDGALFSVQGWLGLGGYL